MALETSGFQLQQLQQSPSIPTNVGKVDTQAIYDSVTSALKQNEALRTLQHVQGLNDASMAYQTAQAQGLLSNLPDTLAADRAKSQLFAAQTNAAMPDVGLAQQAARTGYQAQAVKNAVLSDPAFVKETLAYKNMSPAVKKLTQLQGMLDSGNLDEEQTLAVRRAMGQELTPAQKAKLDADANKVHTMYNNDGVPVQFTNSGAMRVAGQNWMPGSLPPTSTGAPLASMVAPTAQVGGGVAPTAQVGGGVAPILTGGIVPLQAASVFGVGKQAALDAQAQAKSLAKYGDGSSGSAVDRVQGDAAKTSLLSYFNGELQDASKALDVQRTHLISWREAEAKDAVTIAAIDRVRNIVEQDGYKATGGGPVGEFIRNLVNTNAQFANDVAQITSLNTIGTMLKLKAASATGATGFGQLSNQEGDIIRNTLGKITEGKLSPSQMVSVLDRMKADLTSQGASAKQTIESQISQQNSRGWRASIGGYGDPEIAIRAGFTSPAPTSSSAAPQASPEQLSFQQPGSMAPGGMNFRSPAAPENRFSIMPDEPVTPAPTDSVSDGSNPYGSNPDGSNPYGSNPTGEPDNAAPVSAATAPLTRSGLTVLSDSATPEPEEVPAAVPAAVPDTGMSKGALLATAATAAPLAAKYVPQAVAALKNQSMARMVAQLRKGLPGLRGPAMGAAGLGGAAAAAAGAGYLAGEAINERGPAITDALGFTNTKADYGGKSPQLSEILADWYVNSKADPARTLGDRWADAYRAIWAAKIDDQRRAKALGDLRETRKSWASAGYKLTTPVDDFDRQQSETSQR